MEAKGWNNGSRSETGSGYGVRIRRNDRNTYFRRNWGSVFIKIEGIDDFEVRLSESFWNNCIELRSHIIGSWLIEENLAHWERGRPPLLRLEPAGQRRFTLEQRH